MKSRNGVMSKLNHENSATEKWENGTLGLDVKHAKKVSSREAAAVDESLGLQMISIRLQNSLIDDLKQIATLEGLVGYQPLIRRVLTRFVDAEKRRILLERANEAEARARIEHAARGVERPAIRPRKAA